MRAPADKAPDRNRLEQLIEISTLFVGFEGLEKTFDAALGITARALTLGSAIVIASTEGQQQMVVWPRPDRTSAEMEAAKQHAKAAHAYMIGAPSAQDVTVTEQAGRTPLPQSTSAGSGSDGPRYIVIPLVVRGGSVFGALQLEGLTGLDKSDLVFVNAIANQLALALDRRVSWRQQLSRSRALAFCLGDGVVATDLQGRIQLVNRAAEQLLACKERDAQGRRFREIVGLESSEGGSPECPLERVLRTGQALRSDSYLFVRNDGPVFPVGLSCSLVRHDETATGAILTFQDITERKLIENALLQAVRGRDRFLEIVSHDLKNPLSAIMTSTGTLLADPPDLDRRVVLRARIEVIDRSARRMGRLINDLVDFASIEAGHLQWETHPVDPGVLAREATAGFGALGREKQLRFEVEVTGELTFLEADRDRLIQVLENLIGNAAKVTPAGGLIVVAVQQGILDVLFTVSDTGPGIPQVDLPRIFERYQRGANPGYPGNGLGLAIAEGIVKAHGGKIWVESTVGEGSTFCFAIPASRSGSDLLASSGGRQRFPS